MKHDTERDGPLAGLKVIDCATVFAGPLSAMVFADFGADVVKIEHPDGDALRKMGKAKDGHGLWFKVTGRNKRCITLDLHEEDGKAAFLALVKDADVLIENFRTGTLERWGLGWDVLSAAQSAPRDAACHGFRPDRAVPASCRLRYHSGGVLRLRAHHRRGERSADAAAVRASGRRCRLPRGIRGHVRDLRARCAGSGKGQVIDLSLYEPLFALLGGQPSTYDQLGFIQGRSGNRSANNAPRNAYVTKDGRWVALSAAAPSITRRVLELTGGPGTADDPRFRTNADRVRHIDEVDGMVGGWIARHTLAEVLEAFEKAEAAIGPVYDIAQICEDPQYIARESITTVDDPDLGPLRMQNVFPRMLRTPGRVRHAGPRMGQHQREVLDELVESGTLSAEVAARLRAKATSEDGAS